MAPSPSLPEIDVMERGPERDGQPQAMNRRLFMQLLVFECGRHVSPADALRKVQANLQERSIAGALYEDLNHPAGFGVLSWSEDPAHFATAVRPALQDVVTLGSKLRTDFTMLGRSYASGFEPDIAHWLLERPVATAVNPEWPWAVWYPLRRGGAFEKLDAREKGGIMREHAEIGKAYGAANLAHDIRLACHGLDEHDNEFVIGLVGRDLHPLSHIVQSMRRTRQTSEFIVQMGPFFVGRRIWSSTGKAG
jgi:chlorite dismutase